MNLRKRTLDEMITYFNDTVANMEIPTKDKMTLLGMITAIGYEASTTDSRDWISVKDKMPEEYELVLIYSGSEFKFLRFIEVAKYNGKAWITAWNSDEICQVDYWMPLPKPPKENNDG